MISGPGCGAGSLPGLGDDGVEHRVHRIDPGVVGSRQFHRADLTGRHSRRLFAQGLPGQVGSGHWNSLMMSAYSSRNSGVTTTEGSRGRGRSTGTSRFTVPGRELMMTTRSAV